MRAKRHWWVSVALVLSVCLAPAMSIAQKVRYFNAIARADLTQHINDHIKAGGYQLRSIVGYQDGDEVRFATVWGPDDGLPLWTFWDVDSATAIADIESKMPEGYMPVREQGFTTSNGPRFNIIMQKLQNHPAWESRVDMTADDFHAKGVAMGQQGYRLIDMTVYQDGGLAKYGGIWIKDGVGSDIFWNQPPDGLIAAINAHAVNGMTPIRLIGYQTPDGLRFLCIFEKTGSSWFASFDMTEAAFQNEAYEQDSKNATMADLSVYTSGGQPRIAAVWTGQAQIALLQPPPAPAPASPEPALAANAPPPPPPSAPPVSIHCKVEVAKAFFNLGLGAVALATGHQPPQPTDVDESACDGQ